MSTINKIPSSVNSIFDSYPTEVKTQVLNIRMLIFIVASEIGIDKIEETLKWGEPSYLSPHGSTIRIAWSKKRPNHYGIYFNCNSLLVLTFKSIFPKTFTYERKRAILFDLNEKIPEESLKICIAAALQYHKVKHLPNLGI